MSGKPAHEVNLLNTTVRDDWYCSATHSDFVELHNFLHSASYSDVVDQK